MIAALALPGTAERALLAQLLLSPGRTIPASLLIDQLWAESTLPVDPVNALQIRVSKLRRSLRASGAPDVVSREGVGYRASVAPAAVDVIDFTERVRSARARGADSSGQDPGSAFATVRPTQPHPHSRRGPQDPGGSAVPRGG